MNALSVFLSFCLATSLLAQRNEGRINLPEALNEISGLAFYNDSILFAINDSGNLPDIFALNTQGIILKRTRILNVANNDWEDLSIDDKGNLFIADVGNNMNDRKNLSILKIRAADVLNQDSVEAEILYFVYQNQNEFPPSGSSKRYNCEAMFWSNDSLFLLTKNDSEKPTERALSWDRNPDLYVLSDRPGQHIAKKTTWTIPEGMKIRNHGIQDLITASELVRNQWYILTYKHLYILNWNPKDFSKGVKDHIRFNCLKQREAIAVSNGGLIFIGAEKHRILGGPYLYIFNEN